MRSALFLTLALVAGFALAPLTLDLTSKVLAEKATTETVNKAYQAAAIPKSEDSLAQLDSKPGDVKKTITLEAANMVIFKGPVTTASVSDCMRELRKMSQALSKSTDIYLVLDTPGGEIFAGHDLIDFAKALPQKVHTVTLFAASMGFQIAQNLDKRYIIRNGTLMSHRAAVDGVGGQIKGEFESRYKMLRRSVDYLDYVASKRMGLEPKAYEQLIFNEYWVYGFDAVADKAADEEVLVKCGETIKGSYTMTIDTMFGPVGVQFSKCPLIKAPEAIDLSKISIGNLLTVNQAVDLAFGNEREFVTTYITTGKFLDLGSPIRSVFR